VATRYPFGIFEKWRTLAAPGELLVYPALLDEQGAEEDPRSLGLDAPTQRVGAGTEIAGLRGYELGDDARSIHWRRTAALGRLVVIERQSDAASQLTILLDNARPPMDPDGEGLDEPFERAVSEAATLALASLQRGLSVEVLARGARSPLVMAGSPGDPILRFLAQLAAVSPEAAPNFAAYARTARVVRVAVREDSAPTATPLVATDKVSA
jgi:uncharacterized protein (DUF58 family)